MKFAYLRTGAPLAGHVQLPLGRLRSSPVSAYFANAPAVLAVSAGDVCIRQIDNNNKLELEQIARLRAEAFYENQAYGRFKQSFIKQFAEQELRRLAADTCSNPPACLPVVALDENNSCIGSLDIRRTFEADDVRAVGNAVYVQNVAVDSHCRGQGVGRRLIEAAKKVAAEQLHADAVFAHVDCVNDVAMALYKNCGFDVVREDGGAENVTAVGRRALLRCFL